MFEIDNPHIHFNDQDNPQEYSVVLLNRYWATYEDKLITYQINLKEDYYSPQCNISKQIMEAAVKQFPWAEIKFIPRAIVYLGRSY